MGFVKSARLAGSKRMKIAILEQELHNRTATGERGRAIEGYLRGRGHQVDVLAPSPDRLQDFSRFRFSLLSRLKRRALRRRSLPHLWDYVADEMEGRVRAGRYDAVIARLQPVAYTLTRALQCLKIFDVANVAYLELYHSWNADLSELDVLYDKELAIYGSADYILSPHEIWSQFFRQHVSAADKVVTARLGCHPVARRAAYAWPPRLVYAGSYDYIQDPYLLAMLAAQSPFEVHCFGSRDPNYRFLPTRLNYRGYAASMDFLADYQFGLITVSCDRLRRHSPATKFPYYFAHGLPVLFPEWMKEGHTYEAAVPYTEDNFVETVRRVGADQAEWRRLSNAAVHTAATLSWDIVLEPLARLLEGAPERIARPDELTPPSRPS